jgi:WD40 repeat protein
MKKFFTIIIIAIIFYSYVLPMDFDKEDNCNSCPLSLSLQNIAADTSVEQKIKIISTHLNNAIPQGIFFEKAPSDLTEKEYFNLIKIVEDNYKEINNLFLIDLMKENKYFKAAIDYCIKLAHINFRDVTTSTLNIVIDSTQQQPTAKLNNLCRVLKEYVMEYAWGEIKHSYTMQFFGHENKIIDIDIHQKSHRAASISCDGMCKLWDISTGKELYTLLGDTFRHIKFNHDASLLAITEVSTIKIWPITQSKPESPLYIINHNTYYTGKLVFFGKQLAVFEKTIMTQYKLGKNGRITNMGWTRCGWFEDTLIHDRTIHKNCWVFTKNSPYLYLCKQAAINTILKEALPSITKATSYQRLTPYEQNFVKEEMKIKRGVEI